MTLVAAALLVLGLVVGTTLYALGRIRGGAEQARPSAAPASATGSTTPRPPAPAYCLAGEPGHRASHRPDGMVRGGGWSLRAPDGWSSSDPLRVPFGYDVDLVERGDGMIVLGALRIEDEFFEMHRAAGAVGGCLLAENRLLPPGTLIANGDTREVQVPGVRRTLRQDFLLFGPTPVSVQVMIGDTGAPESWALAVIAHPTADPPVVAQSRQAAEGLRRG